jgi:hypothetical protein
VPDPRTGLPVAKNSGPERKQRTFLRRLLSASPSTSLDMLYREARRRPWAYRWAAAVVRFWNSAVDAPEAPCKGKRVTRPDAKTPWLLAFD